MMKTVTNEDLNTTQNFTYTVRQSIVFPIISMILIQIIVIALELVTKIFVDFLNTEFKATLPTYTIMVWTTIVLQSINTFIVVYIFLNWLVTLYIIRPREFTLLKGILKRKEIKYEFEHLEKIEVDQNILGRFFNYGSLKMYSHDLRNEVYIHDVPDPYKYSQAILQNKGSMEDELSKLKVENQSKTFVYK